MAANNVYAHVEGFMALYDGLKIAFGTGHGSWVKRPPTKMDFVRHLMGEGSGIGIAPLRPDNTVMFAAIDLDEPDFDAARDMQQWIPGPSWIERSRSGNAHVLCFFEKPLEAWIAMGILRNATKAAGKDHVEVFPKNHDFARVKLGNYINAAYHGKDRPILWHAGAANESTYTLENFVAEATAKKNDPDKWREQARWLLMEEPQVREVSEGPTKILHQCAEYIIEGAVTGERPIFEGHRSAVYFALSKQLRAYEGLTDDEAFEEIQKCNEVSPDPLPDGELRRIFNNAGNFRSTGCDDPLVQPFTHPDCPITRS